MLRAIVILLACLGAAEAAARTVLTADLTLYANPANGVAGNDCLAATSACPSLQTAWEKLAREYDLAGHGATIVLANGSWTNAGIRTHECLLGQRDAKSVVIDGGASVMITTDGLWAFMTGDAQTAEQASCSRFTVRNMNFYSPGGGGTYGTGGGAINVSGGIVLVGDGVMFGDNTSSDMHAVGGGATILKLPSSGYSIYGHKFAHIVAWSGGIVVIQSVPAVNCGVAVVLGKAFVSADFGNGQVYAAWTSFAGCAAAGKVTGRRYWIGSFGYIDTQSGTPPGAIPGNPNYLPGSLPGTIAVGSNGIYD